jgi:hypothetical protein
VLGFVLDCLACDEQGTVVFVQDPASGELRDEAGDPADVYVCHRCDSADELVPMLVEHDSTLVAREFARPTVIPLPVAA